MFIYEKSTFTSSFTFTAFSGFTWCNHGWAVLFQLCFFLTHTHITRPFSFLMYTLTHSNSHPKFNTQPQKASKWTETRAHLFFSLNMSTNMKINTDIKRINITYIRASIGLKWATFAIHKFSFFPNFWTQIMGDIMCPCVMPARFHHQQHQVHVEHHIIQGIWGHRLLKTCGRTSRQGSSCQYRSESLLKENKAH